MALSLLTLGLQPSLRVQPGAYSGRNGFGVLNLTQSKKTLKR
jgi:hypothetical protein